MYCHQHNKVETAVSCGRCEQPICVRCMSHTDVGVRCKTCAPHGMLPTKKTMKSGGALIGAAIVLIVLIVAGGSLLDTAGSGSGEYDYDYEEVSDHLGSIIANEVVDPWLPESGENQPAEGNRFIAVHLTVENVVEAAIVVSGSWFTLTDMDHFVYEAAEDSARPPLPDSVILKQGERTQGWVTFEVAEESVIASMRVWGIDVPLSSPAAP